MAGGSDGTEVSAGALAFPPAPARVPLPAPAQPCHVGPPAPNRTPPPAWAPSKPEGAEQGDCGAESSLRSRMELNSRAAQLWYSVQISLTPGLVGVNSRRQLCLSRQPAGPPRDLGWETMGCEKAGSVWRRVRGRPYIPSSGVTDALAGLRVQRALRDLEHRETGDIAEGAQAWVCVGGALWLGGLAVQWLRLRAATARGTGSVPVQGTKIPHAMWRGQKIKNIRFNFFKKVIVNQVSLHRS